MNGAEIKQQVAVNLNQWDQAANTGAGAWVEGKITEDKAEAYMNFLWKDDLFPLLSDKYPRDFERATEPFDLWTATGAVHASSSGTTLVATTSIFTNDMINREVINADSGEKIKIVDFTSATVVTLEEAPSESWSGDTICVLGNEFAISKSPSEATDVKEILDVFVQYTPTDIFRPAENRAEYHLIRHGNENYPSTHPYWYDKNLKVDDVIYKGVGVIPYPTGYQGKAYVVYSEKPVDITDSTSPLLHAAGVGLVLVNGVTSWAMGVKGEDQAEIDRYKKLYDDGKQALLYNYKPKNRRRPARSRAGSYMRAISSRAV